MMKELDARRLDHWIETEPAWRADVAEDEDEGDDEDEEEVSTHDAGLRERRLFAEECVAGCVAQSQEDVAENDENDDDEGDDDEEEGRCDYCGGPHTSVYDAGCNELNTPPIRW